MSSHTDSNMNGSDKGEGVKRRMSMTSGDSVEKEHSTDRTKKIKLIIANEEATKPLTSKPLTEFHLFGKFPQELRSMIWKQTLKKDVAVQIRNNGGLYPMKGVFNDPSTPVLLVNREARDAAQRNKVMYGSFPFNRDTDTLHLFFPLNFWASWLDFGESSPLSSLKVKRVVLNGFYFRRSLGIDNSSLDQIERRTQQFFAILSKMPELKTIAVPTTGKDVTSRTKDADQSETDAQEMANFEAINKSYQEKAKEFQKEFRPEWQIPALVYLQDHDNKPKHFSADQY